MDEAAGQARLALAAASRARKAAEAEELARRNAEMRKRLTNARGRTTSPPRGLGAVEPISSDEIVAAAAAVAAARLEMARAREAAERRLTADQRHMRASLAHLSKRTPPRTTPFSPSIGKRTAAMYRLDASSNLPPDGSPGGIGGA